eukprot:scaffold10284_cov118-Isochrysis_galbana.AAC.14
MAANTSKSCAACASSPSAFPSTSHSRSESTPAPGCVSAIVCAAWTLDIWAPSAGRSRSPSGCTDIGNCATKSSSNRSEPIDTSYGGAIPLQDVLPSATGSISADSNASAHKRRCSPSRAPISSLSMLKVAMRSRSFRATTAASARIRAAKGSVC